MKTETTKQERKAQIKDAVHDAMRILAEELGPRIVLERHAAVLSDLTEALAHVDAL